MTKPLNFTGTPNGMYQEYLYQDELTEILNEVATSPSKLGKLTVPLTVDRLVDVARAQHRMELRAVSVSTRGDTRPYTEEELLEVFNPSVVLLPQMPYGYYFHKSLEEAGFRVMYHEDTPEPETKGDTLDNRDTEPTVPEDPSLIKLLKAATIPHEPPRPRGAKRILNWFK